MYVGRDACRHAVDFCKISARRKRRALQTNSKYEHQFRFDEKILIFLNYKNKTPSLKGKVPDRADGLKVGIDENKFKRISRDGRPRLSEIYQNNGPPGRSVPTRSISIYIVGAIHESTVKNT